jgi:hypothetical protein
MAGNRKGGISKDFDHSIWSLQFVAGVNDMIAILFDFLRKFWRFSQKPML